MATTDQLTLKTGLSADKAHNTHQRLSGEKVMETKERVLIEGMEGGGEGGRERDGGREREREGGRERRRDREREGDRQTDREGGGAAAATVFRLRDLF